MTSLQVPPPARSSSSAHPAPSPPSPASTSGLPRYDRDQVDGLRLQFGDVRAVIDTVIDQDYEARAAQPCIGPGRGDVMIAGCAILEAVMAACPAGQLDVADRGLREGMLLRMMRAARADHGQEART